MLLAIALERVASACESTAVKSLLAARVLLHKLDVALVFAETLTLLLGLAGRARCVVFGALAPGVARRGLPTVVRLVHLLLASAATFSICVMLAVITCRATPTAPRSGSCIG